MFYRIEVSEELENLVEEAAAETYSSPQQIFIAAVLNMLDPTEIVAPKDWGSLPVKLYNNIPTI